MLNKWLHLLQSLVARLKENLEKLTEERDQRSASENREKEQNKRLLRQIRDVKEEMAELAKKEAEASRKKHELVRSLLWLFTQPHVIPNQFDFFLLKNTKEDILRNVRNIKACWLPLYGEKKKHWDFFSEYLLLYSTFVIT